MQSHRIGKQRVDPLVAFSRGSPNVPCVATHASSIILLTENYRNASCRHEK